MEDKDLKDLFDSYSPDISPDLPFMTRLERSMDSVEMIRERQMHARKTQRRAMAIAVAVGFLTGIIMAFILPLACAPLFSFGPQIHHQVACMADPPISPIYYWAVIGLFSVLMTFTSYDLTLGFQRNKSNR